MSDRKRRLWVLGMVCALIAERVAIPADPPARGKDATPQELPEPRPVNPADVPDKDAYPSKTSPAATAAAAPLPIDLVTALRLTDENNPTVAVAEARVQEALARLDRANVLYLPDLTAGTTYFRHSGIDQNRRGDMFKVVRSNVFVGGGPQLRVNVAEAIYLPLVARQLAAATRFTAQATRNDVQFQAASAYLDLLRVYAALAVNADTLARAEQMLARAEAADKAGLSKTAGDVNRARTEVNVRREERINLEGSVGVASARLGRVLYLTDTVDLKPADPAVVPITLVPPQSLDNLVAIALATRPEMAANRAEMLAAEQRIRQAKAQPLIPNVQLDYVAGGFGGGRDGYIGDWNGRGDFTAQAVWGLDNLGFGYKAEVRVRQAQYTQARYRAAEQAAEVRAEVLESAKAAAARFRSLGVAQEAVRQGVELFRKLEETSFGMVDRRQYDALEPLTAIQQLNQARVRYLDEVIEFNRSQFRLYTALGQPPATALFGASSSPVEVSTTPPPFTPIAAPKSRPAKDRGGRDDEDQSRRP